MLLVVPETSGRYHYFCLGAKLHVVDGRRSDGNSLCHVHDKGLRVSHKTQTRANSNVWSHNVMPSLASDNGIIDDAEDVEER